MREIGSLFPYLVNHKICLVLFTRDNCPACEKFKSFLNKLKDSHKEMDFSFINLDKHPEEGIDFSIVGVPTSLLFVDGKPTGVFFGFSEDTIQNLQKALVSLQRVAS